MQALSPKDTETGTELPTQADSLDDLDEDQLAQMLETLL